MYYIVGERGTSSDRLLQVCIAPWCKIPCLSIKL